MLRQQADQIIGLNPQMMGEVEERSGKGTTLQAIHQGQIVLKELLFIHAQAMRKLLTGVVNLSRVSYREKPLLSSYSVGDNYRIFNIGGKKYSLCDFNVQVVDDSEEAKISMKADELVNLAIQSQTVKFKEAFELITSKSVSRKRQVIARAEDSQNTQMTQQLQEMQKQIEELTKQNEELTKKANQIKELDAQIKQKELEIKEKKVNNEIEIKEKELKIKEREKENKVEIDKEKIQVEKAQLFDDNKRNDQYNWSK